MENRVESLISRLKEISFNPVAVGFGISSPEHIDRVHRWGANGVIIGSAFVKRISNSAETEVVNVIGNFCEEMRKAADQKV